MLNFELYVCFFQHKSTVHGNIRVPICTNHDLIKNMEPILLNCIYLQMHVHPSVSFFLLKLDLPVLIYTMANMHKHPPMLSDCFYVSVIVFVLKV